MKKPKWLTRADIEALHEMAIDKAGGSRGLRDDDGFVTMMENLGQGKISREMAGTYLQENCRSLQQTRTDKS